LDGSEGRFVTADVFFDGLEDAFHVLGRSDHPGPQVCDRLPLRRALGLHEQEIEDELLFAMADHHQIRVHTGRVLRVHLNLNLLFLGFVWHGVTPFAYSHSLASQSALAATISSRTVAASRFIDLGRLKEWSPPSMTRSSTGAFRRASVPRRRSRLHRA